MDYPKFIFSNQKDESLCIQRVKIYSKILFLSFVQLLCHSRHSLTNLASIRLSSPLSHYRASFDEFSLKCMFLSDLILNVPVDNFSVMSGRVFLGKLVLSKDKCVLPLRLEPAAPRSQVKHSTTEPLCSLKMHVSLYS